MSEEARPESNRYEEAVDWLFRLQEDQSTESIERWIEWCCADPRNQQAFESLMPLWQVKLAMPDHSVTVTPVAAPSPEGQRQFLRPPVRLWASLAAAVAAVAIGLAMLMHRGEEVRLGANDDLNSAHGVTRAAQLADGSQVALGPQSRIAVNFHESQRVVELESGEAFFTVHHDRLRPFLVGAGSLQVRAVGTSFDVDRRGQRVSVTVKDGIVEVTDRRVGAAHIPLRVASGSQLIFDDDSDGTPLVRLVSPESADSWRRGRFEYVSEPLSSIVEDLNRYASEHIQLRDQSVGQLRYSGTIDLALINEWLRALPSIFIVNVQFGNDHQVTLYAPTSTSGTQ